MQAIDNTINNVLPIHYACCEGRLDAVKILMESGCFDADDTDHSDWAPLHHAIAAGHLPIVQYLLEEQQQDADEVLDCVKGRDAIREAISEGHLSVIKYLTEEAGWGRYGGRIRYWLDAPSHDRFGWTC